MEKALVARYLGFSMVGMLLSIVSIGCGQEAAPTQTIPPDRPADTAQVDNPTPASAQELRDIPGIGAIEELNEFRKRFGDPPDSTLGRFRIPRIGIDAPLGGRVVASDGTMPLPSGPSDVVWYDFSGWQGYGGAPGAGGNAVFAGHVDYAARVPYAGANYRGRGVFFALELLRPGDEVDVEASGKNLRYIVVWAKTVPEGRGRDWAEIMSAKVGADSITLITCAGAFDSGTLSYADRLVVRAIRE